MKQKIKEFSKKYLVGFIIGSILFGTLGVYAVTYFPGLNTTYDNSDSGMTSTNVQDALDELYNVCVPPKAADQIIEDNNLEKDPYECRYFFTGANPNNYITFNDEKAAWRIISIECDGTIKIMRTASIGNQYWDTSRSNKWARPASLNKYLNGTYYNELNTTAQNQIVSKDWSIGAIEWEETTMSKQVSDENSELWQGNIALPTLSEYIRSNSNKSGCGTFSLINDNSSSCVNTGWMDTTSVDYWWTLSSYFYSSDKSFGVYLRGQVSMNNVGSYEICAVRPALYLSSDIQITGGTGTQNDPYTIA